MSYGGPPKFVDPEDTKSLAKPNNWIRRFFLDYSVPVFAVLLCSAVVGFSWYLRLFQFKYPFELLLGIATIGLSLLALVVVKLKRTANAAQLYAESMRHGIKSLTIEIRDRKKTEHALVQTEKRFRELVENINDVVYATDNKGIINYISPVIEPLSGYEPFEVIGRSFTEFIHSDDLAEVKASFDKILAGELEPLEFRVLTKNGRVRWVSSSSRPAYKKNCVIGLRGVITDITARKRADDSLRVIIEGTSSVTGDEFLYSLVRHVANALQVRSAFVAECTDKTKTKVKTLAFWKGDGFGENFEYELSGTPCEDVIGGNICCHSENLQALFPGHKILTELNAEGYLGIPLKDSGGAPIGHLAVLNDNPIENDTHEISILKIFAARAGAELERKRAEGALQKSEKRFKELFESSPNAIFVYGSDGNLLDVNPEACRLQRMTYEELISKNVAELVPHSLREKTIKHFDNLFKDGYGYSEGLSRTKEGIDIPIEIRVKRFHFADQPALLFHVHDISRRKRLEEQLLQAQKMEAIGTLAGGIAHDFNNILTVILGNVEFGLQSAPVESSVNQELQNIEKAALQARDLTGHLLTFSRNHEHKPKVVNLNEIITEQMKLLMRCIGEDIQITTRLDAQLNTILGDPTQIQQILMNLAVNARDAMPKGGKLTISTRNFSADDNFLIEQAQVYGQNEIRDDSGNYVEIIIEDTGLGIERKNQAHIFEPFFTTKEVGKGTGLGLAVVYGIVKQHQGSIQIESKVKKGTSFKIYFPAMSKLEVAKTNKISPKSIEGGHETILVVEDEEAVRKLCQRILEPLGYKIITAQNGKEALSLFKNGYKNIDLVIMDVVMPEMSGPDAFKEISIIQPDLPTIFVTGYDIHDEMLKIKDLTTESPSMLQKPYTQETLCVKIREILDKRKNYSTTAAVP